MPVSMPPRRDPLFVDADDYIDAQTVERVLHAMESADAEAAVFGGVCEPADAAPKRVRQLMSPKAGTFGARDPQLLFHSNAQPYACRAAFSRELLNREGIRFAPVWLWARTSSSICGLCACPQDRRHAGQVLPLRDGERIGDARVQQCRGSRQKLDAHMRMLEEVLEDWAAYGLWTCAPAS